MGSAVASPPLHRFSSRDVAQCFRGTRVGNMRNYGNVSHDNCTRHHAPLRPQDILRSSTPIWHPHLQDLRLLASSGRCPSATAFQQSCVALQEHQVERRMLAAAVTAMQGGIALRAWRAWQHYAQTRAKQRALLQCAVVAITQNHLFRAFGAWQVGDTATRLRNDLWLMTSPQHREDMMLSLSLTDHEVVTGVHQNGSMQEVCACYCSWELVVLAQDKTAQQQCKKAAMAQAAAALRGGLQLRAWRSWAGRHAEKALRRIQLQHAVGALLLPRCPAAATTQLSISNLEHTILHRAHDFAATWNE